MRWQRAARIVLAAAGIGCAGAIVYFARQRPPVERPAPIAAVDPSASLEGGAGTFVYGESGTSRVRIVFDSSRRYDDGRMRFENARISGLDRSAFTVRADVLETRGPGGDRPSLFDLTGGIELETDDGLKLQTSRAEYDDNAGIVSMPEGVTFSRGRLSGQSTGATYSRDDLTIQLLSDARVTVAPSEDGRGRAEGTASRMTLVRGQKSLRLEENARLTDDTEIMTADVAMLYFTEDERTLKYLELRGRAAVDPQPGQSDAPTMRSENITLAFDEAGRTLQHSTLTGRSLLTTRSQGVARSIRASWIDLYMGPDGRTLTRLDARDQVLVELPPSGDTPGRTITATTLSATGTEQKGLTAARFDGRPKFEEHAKARGSQSVRTGTADALVLALDGGLDAISRAEFRGGARFLDGDVTAEADVAFYEEKKGLLSLQPGSGAAARRSRVTGPDLTVEGQGIDLFVDTHNLNARGAVTTRTSGKPRAGAAEPAAVSGLFTGGEPAYGSSETLQYEQESGTAVYTGSAKIPARLRQDETEIAADKIRVADASGNLDATGRVDSLLIFTTGQAGDEKQTEPQRYRVLADSLAYDDTKRTAVYRGQPVRLTSRDGDTEGNQLTLALGATSRTLEKMTVEGVVYAKMSGGYEADGASLVYQAGSDTYLITGGAGRPARVKSPSTSGGGCLLTRGLALEFNRQTGSVRSTGRGQAPGSTDAVSCDVSLRSIR